MFRTCCWVVFLALAGGPAAQAELVFESATLDQTGLNTGATASSTAYVGVRFELTESATARAIGAHVFENVAGGKMFAALVQLSSISDFPDSADLSTSDVLGVGILDLAGPSSDEFVSNFQGDAQIGLAPGFYAIVLGSDLFGATSIAGIGGGAPRQTPENAGTDIGTVSHFKFKAGEPGDDGQGYSNEPSFAGVRVLLDDQFAVIPIPEPGSIALALLALAFLVGYSLVLKRSGKRQPAKVQKQQEDAPPR